MLKKEIFLSNFKSSMDENPEMDDYVEEKMNIIQLCDDLFGPYKEIVTIKDQCKVLVEFCETYKGINTHYIAVDSIILDSNTSIQDEIDAKNLKNKKTLISLKYEGILLDAANAYFKTIRVQPIIGDENKIDPELISRFLDLLRPHPK
jgi:hypothetical protein